MEAILDEVVLQVLPLVPSEKVVLDPLQIVVAPAVIAEGVWLIVTVHVGLINVPDVPIPQVEVDELSAQ